MNHFAVFTGFCFFLEALFFCFAFCSVCHSAIATSRLKLKRTPVGGVSSVQRCPTLHRAPMCFRGTLAADSRCALQSEQNRKSAQVPAHLRSKCRGCNERWKGQFHMRGPADVFPPFSLRLLLLLLSSLVDHHRFRTLHFKLRGSLPPAPLPF